MAAPYATPDDVATYLKVTFSPADQAQCVMVLAGVSAIIRSRLPSLDAWIADGSVDPVLAQLCAITMVKDLISLTEAAGKKSESYPEYTVIWQDIGTAGLDVTDSWINLLTPAASRNQRGQAFSITPG